MIGFWGSGWFSGLLGGEECGRRPCRFGVLILTPDIKARIPLTINILIVVYYNIVLRISTIRGGLGGGQGFEY